jgi:hypothetical protein
MRKLAALSVAIAAAIVAGTARPTVTEASPGMVFAAPSTSQRTGQARLSLSPAVVQRGQTAAIAVSGIRAASLEVRLVGATKNLGVPLPWAPLHLRAGAWRGTLPAPEFRGVYPLELRVGGGSSLLRSDRWLLRVYASGTLSRPSFGTPEEAARSWLRTLPGPATFVAIKNWRQPAFDRREPRLHQLFALAYEVPGPLGVPERLGMFVMAVRDGFQGKWRLLEATVVP